MRTLLRTTILLAVLAGCYSPFPPTGAPCRATAECPTPQRCVLGACSLRDAPEIDASVPELPDAAEDIDAAPPPPDAARLACSTAGLACPGGTVTMFTCGGNCWVRCTGNVSRDTARAACAGWMGALGQIDDATEQSCVAPRATADSWLALVQVTPATSTGMGWTWNSTAPLSYTHWQSGQPDDSDNREDGDEQCAKIQADGLWDDAPCSNTLDFFCERP